MSKLIHLKDYSDIYKQEDEYQFIKAYATNSRLMGVVGVRLHFTGDKPLTLFFHLDFEEYGFDRFESYQGDDSKNIDRITQSFMGGLGSELKEINLKEASSLIYNAVDVGDRYFYDVPLEFFDFEYLIEDYCEPMNHELCQKVCTPIRSDYEAIHYFFMRTLGLDYQLRDFKFSEGPLEFVLCEEPTVLLKNTITMEEDSYICRTIIDHYDAYKMIVTRLHLENQKITSHKVLNELVLSSKEASFQLNKKERLLICFSDDIEAFKSQLEQKKPSMLTNIYEGGTLYTEFNVNNDHVNCDTFYLNGDVFATYYVTNTNHIVISCFEEKSLAIIKEMLPSEFDSTNTLVELEAENPILYDFVTSGLQDFFDYLGD